MVSYFTRYDRGVRLNCGKKAFDEWYYDEMGKSMNTYDLSKKGAITSDKHGYLLLQYSVQNLNKIYPNYDKNVYTVPRYVSIHTKHRFEGEPWVEFVVHNFLRANFPGVVLIRIIEIDKNEEAHAGMVIIERLADHQHTILATIIDSSATFSKRTLQRIRNMVTFLVKQTNRRLAIVWNNDYIKNHQKEGYCVYNAYAWTMMYLLRIPVTSTKQEHAAVKDRERISSRDQICKRTMNNASAIAITIGERCVDQQAEFPLIPLFTCSFRDINSALKELFREWIDIFTVPYKFAHGKAREFLFSQPPTHEHYIRCLADPKIRNTIDAYQYFFDVRKIYCSIDRKLVRKCLIGC